MGKNEGKFFHNKPQEKLYFLGGGCAVEGLYKVSYHLLSLSLCECVYCYWSKLLWCALFFH